MWKRFKEWLFPKISNYRIERSALETMRAMALQTHPKEAFAVLRGKHNKDTLIIKDIAYQPFSNTEYSAHAIIDKYTVTDMVGTFHSHPIPDARPSRADKYLFQKHPGIHCILAYPYAEAAVYSQQGEFLGTETISYP